METILIENTKIRGNARALCTQEAHRRQGSFKPYKYHGTGEDTLTAHLDRKPKKTTRNNTRNTSN